MKNYKLHLPKEVFRFCFKLGSIPKKSQTTHACTMLDDPRAAEIEERERQLRNVGRMPRCCECGEEASQVYHEDVGLGGDDIEGMMMGLAYGEEAAFCFAQICDNACSSCSRHLCFNCQKNCASRLSRHCLSKPEQRPVCTSCSRQKGFSTCAFCCVEQCGACMVPHCQDCGGPTCPGCTSRFKSNRPFCSRCFFKCAKCHAMCAGTSCQKCTTCDKLRCPKCLVKCVDCLALRCCDWSYCETCGSPKCRRCPAQHSCAISNQDEDIPVSWQHDLNLLGRQTHRPADQLAIDVGEAVLFLSTDGMVYFQKPGQLSQCTAQLYEFRTRTISSFQLSIPGDVARNLVPTRFSSNTKSTVSAVGHQRRLLMFNSAATTFCVIDLSHPRSLTTVAWKSFDSSKLSSTGFVVLACCPARAFNPLRHSHEVAMVLWQHCDSGPIITLHFFTIETGVFFRKSLPESSCQISRNGRQ